MTSRVRLYGLVIDSHWPLPGEPVEAEKVDVSIRPARLAITGPEGVPIAIEGGTAFRIEGLGSFAVRHGSTIEVDVPDGEDPRNVRLYLVGTALGLVLFQRGEVPLHANAIDIGGEAIAVMGGSGAGKSTLALAARDLGYRTLTDDVAVIRFDGDRPVVSPGLPHLRLWRDAVERSGRSTDALPRAYASEEPWDKFELEVGGEEFRTPLPVKAIYQLEAGPGFAIRPVKGAEAAGMLVANVYRGGWASGAREARAILLWAARLAGAVPVYHFTRRWDAGQIRSDAERLLEAAKG